MAKVARSVDRLDFWNVYAEMTPYEISVTQALWQIEPWGDDRADLRQAVNTVAGSGVEEGKAGEAVEELANYLEVNRVQPQEISPDEAARLGTAAFAKIGK
jgi:hypothetical protein